MNKAKAISDETRIQEFTSRILRRVFFELESNPDCDGTALFGPIEEELTELVKETRAVKETAAAPGDWRHTEVGYAFEPDGNGNVVGNFYTKETPYEAFADDAYAESVKSFCKFLLERDELRSATPPTQKGPG